MFIIIVMLCALRHEVV